MSRVQPTVRAMVPDDADPVGRLHVATWRSAYRDLVRAEYLARLDVEERIVRHRRHVEAASADHRFWVSETPEEIGGFCITGPCRDEDVPAGVDELYAIYVAPHLIGSGHGRVLMERALEDWAQRGIEEVVLWALVGNTRAERFYARAGFVRDARIEATPHGDSGADKARWVRREGR